MKKIILTVAILLHFTMTAAYCQSYSTLTPLVVGQPAVAIHSSPGPAPQVYQYSAPITIQPAPPVLPSTHFVYDLGSGNSALQFNSNGATLVFPLTPIQ